MRRGTPYLSLISGGGQERQRRAGTEDVASIAGMASALREAQASHESYTRTCRALTTRLVEGVLQSIPGARLTGHPEMRLPNNAHFSFEGAESDAMLDALDRAGIAASAGSACNSATWEPSHVMNAIGMPLRRAFGVLRFTVGPENTDAEIDRVLSVLPDIVAESRGSPRRVGK
jgi:cysteine desulfurase